MSTPRSEDGLQPGSAGAPMRPEPGRDSRPYNADVRVPLEQSTGPYPEQPYYSGQPQQSPVGQPPFGVQQPPPSAETTGPVPVVQQGGPELRGSVSGGPPPHKHSRAGAAWVALVVAAVVLVFLLIFVGQNSGAVQVRYLGFEGTMPLGVAMAFAAVAGALTAALLGTVRIMQLRARARRAAAGR